MKSAYTFRIQLWTSVSIIKYILIIQFKLNKTTDPNRFHSFLQKIEFFLTN